ncbi:hypothetical protein [uncultured Streptococcus sp.]|jgi:hypothetical protein|uniref:hypothetical protein n=1 Tax=uncultured Streptococcus sp. TaxID=83427 RepID=UPI0025CEE680|nr:hypothetical protein [uncultured Streptococcus sp.]
MDLPKDINSTFVWLDTLSDPYSDDSIARRLAILCVKDEIISRVLDMPIERIEELRNMNTALSNKMKHFAINLKKELETIPKDELMLIGVDGIDDAISKTIGMDIEVYDEMLKMFRYNNAIFGEPIL